MSGPDKTVSVVIPAFRESERIADTISAVLSHFSELGDDLEVIVADDGSDDSTAEAALQAAGGQSRVKVVRLAAHTGKGAAVRAGIIESTGGSVLVVDADLAIPLGEYAALEARLEAGADVVIGSKELGRREGRVRQPLLRTAMGRIFNLVVRALVLPGLWDTQAGFKLFRGAAAREMAPESRLDGFAYDVEMLALARRRGLRVVEVPVSCRPVGQTSVRVVSDSLVMLRDLVGLRVRFGRVKGRAGGA